MRLVTFFITLLYITNANAIVFEAREGIKYDGASPLIITIVIISVILVIIGIIVGVIFQEKKRKQKLSEHSDYQFARQCERFGLSSNEQFSLKKYLTNIGVLSHPSVFNSVSIFEEAVDRECETVKKRWGISSKSENSTLIIRGIRRKLGYDNLLSETPLQSTRNYEVGQKLELLPALDSPLKLENVTVMESSELVMTLRYDPKKLTFDITRLDKIVLSYTRQGDAIYTVSTEIFENDISTGMLKVIQSAQIDRKQFRDNVRMSLDIPLQCRLLHRNSAAKNSPLGKLVENSYILDVSAGGMAFIADSSLEARDRVSLAFTLAKRKYVIKGDVIGIIEKERRGEIRYKHRIAFRDVKRADSDAIVRFIFEKQREQMHVNFNEH